MTTTEFVKKLAPHAKTMEAKTGISATFVLAQAALESGWGKYAPGNMYFGVTDTDGVNGNEQLLKTTEYLTHMNGKFPKIESITPVMRNGKKYYKYVCWRYFRKYATPEESFTDHANLFLRVKRYAKALEVKNDPYKFATEVAKAGYATAPSYATSLHSVIRRIEDVRNKLKI